MKKRLSLALFATAMLFSFAACGDEEATTEATTEAVTEAATDDATEEATEDTASADSADGATFDKMHGLYTLKYDESVYREATSDDLFGDLIPVDETKNAKLYVAVLDSVDDVQERMDSLKEKDSEPEEIKLGDYTGYLYEYEEDLMGYTCDFIVPFNKNVKSEDGYYNNAAAAYIYGSDTNKDLIKNDDFMAIIKSVEIGDVVAGSSDSDDAADSSDDSTEAAEAEEHSDYGKSNPDATGIVTLDKLKACYNYIKENSDVTYEDCVAQFGADGAPWFELESAFTDEKHAYKWETEGKEDFLYVSFKVNEDGSETYTSCTYSTAVAE